MNKKCYNCIYYIPFEDDCSKDQYSGCELKGDSCTVFTQRKQCKHRWESCEDSCNSICRSTPSVAGCRFMFKCNLDDRECDEQCHKHEKNKRIHSLKCRLIQLSSSRDLLDILIKECKEELESLK